MENTPKISQKEIIEAITSSGYLIEQRVASIISEKGFNVSLNDIYKDFETGKTREVDIHAFAIFPIKKEKYEDNVCYLYFECENNQQPVIFFKNSENENTPFLFEDIKITGSPIFIHPNSKMIDIGEFLKFDNFHHYCKNAIYTQYCTFTRTKNKEGKWIATHSTDQHDTFINLIKCIKYHMNHGIDYYHVGSEDFSGFKRLGLSFFFTNNYFGRRIV